MTSNDDTTTAPVPVGDEPIEGTVIPPVDHQATASAAEPQDEPDAQEEVPAGVPVGQIAAGGLSTAAVALGSLYQLLGLPGLIGGAVLTGSGAAAYVRHRYARSGRDRRTWGVSWEDGQNSRNTSRRTRRSGGGGGGGLGDLLGGSRSEGRSTRSGRPGGRSGGSGGSGGSKGSGDGLLGGLLSERGSKNPKRSKDSKGSTRPGGAGGGLGALLGRRPTGKPSAAASSTRPAGTDKKTAATGTTGGTGKPAKPGATGARPLTAGDKARNATHPTGTGSQGGSQTRSQGRARNFGHRAQQGARRVAEWVDDKSGGRAGRAYRRARRADERLTQATAAAVRRGALWADRKSGQRVSKAWAAARGTGGFRAAQQRALGVLSGWDARMTAALVAVIATLMQRWRAARSSSSTTVDVDAGSAAEAGQGAHDSTAAPPAQDASAATSTTPTSTPSSPTIVAAAGSTPAATAEATVSVNISIVQPLPPLPPLAPSATGFEQGFTTSTAPTAGRLTAHPHYRRNTVGFPLADAAAELNSAAVYIPEHMLDILRQLDRLPEIPTQVAIAINTYGAKLHNTKPLDPRVADLIMQLRDSLGRSAEIAAEIGPLARRIHAPDLRRHVAPRVDEAAWDYSRR